MSVSIGSVTKLKNLSDVQRTEAYSEPAQTTFMIEIFVEVVNDWKTLTIVGKSSILDV